MIDHPDNRTIIHDGLHVSEVLNILSGEIKTLRSLLSIKEKASQIIDNSVNPIADPSESKTVSHENDGLLYGLIQSGKTSIITVAIAMAADNGFQCIVVLTADIDVLYKQTLERVRSALPGLSVLGKNDWRADQIQRFERQLKIPPFVIVCSKNPRKLGGLLEAFKAVNMRGFSAIIVDDEADQASLNTYASRGGQVSKINEVITDFRKFFRVNTYLQVTATPQALFLQRPEGFYRPSFTVLSKPGPGYIGGEAFFGLESKLLRSVDLDEVEQLRTTYQPAPTGSVPPGLRRALYSFLIAATAKKIQNPTEENYAFLCHVSVNTADHRHIVNLLDRFKEETIRILHKPFLQRYQKLIQDLENEYRDLSGTQPGLPTFDQVVEKIKFYLHGANIKLVNALTNEEIKLDSVYNVFVGGNKLGRGVTIKNLLTSYYGRNPKRPNADTVLQHARMYGYRQDEIKVTRLFLPEKLAEHFRLIHQMESALRELVSKHPKGKFEGIYISSPLRATRPNVLDPNAIGMYVAGSSYNPAYPLRTKDVERNTDWLDLKLSEFDDQSAGKEVTIDFIIELLGKCAADPKHGVELWDQKTLVVALEKLKVLRGDKAYLVVRRRRNLMVVRRETQGILDSGEDKLASKDAPTLFMYRQNEVPAKGEIAVWWPQLRFSEGNYVMAFSFNK